MTTLDIDRESVNNIRVLAADVVEKAKSGHPGMPMGMAPAAHVLWSKFLQVTAKDPKWPNRDRFVLSNGHGCALLYTMLHLNAFKVTMDDLKQFRQWGSNTPGHPESFMTEGIEVTTGPLGQGIANAVGMAIAEAHQAAIFNKADFEIFSNYTYVFCGDGCLQEGIASEAASLAGHLQLGRLIIIYDANEITIDGSTDLSFTEDVPKRFEAYGWHTLSVENGNEDLRAIEDAISEAQSVTDRPTLISLKTTIGYLSSKAGTHGVHGAPLGADDLKGVKRSVGYNEDASFVLRDDVAAFWSEVTATNEARHDEWTALLARYATAFPQDHARLQRVFAGNLPENWKDALPTFDGTSPKVASRVLSGQVLNAVASVLPELIGGSADLTPSNNTTLKGEGDFQASSPQNRYLRFGIREHGMVAIGNGITAYGGLIPFTATFLNFITYAYPAVRLAALSHLRQILIMTHDSIGLGEDGPTHQPVEVLSLLRATPNLNVHRPADGNEVVAAYHDAIEHNGPTVLALSRQGLPALANSCPNKAAKGAYILEEPSQGGAPDLVLIATGSEVGLALESVPLLAPLRVRVVSAPCLDIFRRQSVEYRREVLPVKTPVVSIEAQGPLGWSDYAHASVAVPEWGASAPGPVIMEKLGFSTANVAAVCKKLTQETLPIGALPCHYE